MDQAAEKVPVDQLAQLEYDKSVLFFGVVPLIVIAVLAVICLVLYYVRRSKSWNELGEAMRIDDGDKPLGSGTPEGFGTKDLQELDPTKPSQRISKLSKGD